MIPSLPATSRFVLQVFRRRTRSCLSGRVGSFGALVLLGLVPNCFLYQISPMERFKEALPAALATEGPFGRASRQLFRLSREPIGVVGVGYVIRRTGSYFGGSEV